MLPTQIASAFESTVLVSTAAALALGALSLRRPEPRSEPGPPWPLPRRLFAHPLAQLALVCFALWVNQILFSAYVVRAHGGSASFIARYIGGGWFAIDARDPIVRFVAAHAGDGHWLSPSLLRVQAFLELPFTLFAYLAVARMLGSGLYRRLTNLPALYLTSISWTVTFSLVELLLQNPWTIEDIVLRAISTAIVPLYVGRLSRRPRASLADDGPTGVLGLLAFLAGAGAISYVVLAVYDAFLLYNLAHLSRYVSGLAVASAIAAAAAFAAPRVDAWIGRASRTGRSALSPSPGMDVCISSLRSFTLLFFIPSLALRYRGGHAYAVACGALVVGIALLAGTGAAVRRVLEREGARLATLFTLVVSSAAAVAAGGWAAGLALTTMQNAGMPELALARVSLAFLAALIVTFRAVEIAVCWTRHEAKAQADEA